MIEYETANKNNQRKIKKGLSHIRLRPKSSGKFKGIITAFTENSRDYTSENWEWIGNKYHKKNKGQMPSAFEIQEGLIKETEVQVNASKIPMSNDELDEVEQNFEDIVVDLFKLAKKKKQFYEPLTKEILSNSEEPIVQLLIYLFAMESFIPYVLNKASRDRDYQKIKTMGPYAAALGVIIGWAQEPRSKEDES